MITGIIIGFAAGLTLATLMWTVMLMRGTNKQSENAKKVEELLFRKAEGIERIADLLEKKIN